MANQYRCDQTGELAEPSIYGGPPTGWISVTVFGTPEPVRHFRSVEALAAFYAAQLGRRLAVNVAEQAPAATVEV